MMEISEARNPPVGLLNRYLAVRGVAHFHGRLRLNSPLQIVGQEVH
jgi:hypothetical protein